MNTLSALMHDEAGFIVSAELILIATILVIGLIVGLSEVQHAVVSELNDVADSIGSLNQGFYYSGMSSRDGYKLKAAAYGSSFNDTIDDCDNNQCQLSCDMPQKERYKSGR